ncbi:MAG: hypothetical protein ACOY3P_17130 [Planctomycetota bacterium]
MAGDFCQSDLEAYLDEALPAERMAEVEKAARDDPNVSRRLAAIVSRRNSGVHSLGEMWRRERVSCPTRDQLGSFLLDALTEELTAYVEAHVQIVGCRMCQANLEDLKRQQQESTATTGTRRQKYFQSSAGYLRSNRR